MKETIDIRPQDLEIVKAILRQHLPAGAKVYAFGSRVSWTAHAGSDLDLAIDAGRKLSLAETTALADAFEESDLPYKVDVVDWVSITRDFRELISSSLEVINISRFDICTIGEITVNYDGKRSPIKESQRIKGKYPYYGASGIIDYVESYIFEGEHLLVAEDGENLRTRKTPIAFLVNGKFWVNNHAHVIIGNDKANTRYICYALQVAEISAYITGSIMPKLSQQNLKRIPIPLPPLPTQKAIADILGALDDKIENNRKTAAKLEEMARALFQSWFVDFDPVKAKSQGQAPFGMDAETAALFPDRLVESELGMIPEGWEVGTLKDIALLQNGFTFSSKSWIKDGVPVVKIGSVKPMIVDLSDVSYVSMELASTLQNYQLEEGAILIGMTGYVGEVGLVIKSKHKPLLNQRVGRIVPVEEYLHSFVYCVVRNYHFKEYAVNVATGSAQANLSTKDILRYSLVIPSKQSQGVIKVFNEKATGILKRILDLEFEIVNIIKLRDYLLPRLISGSIIVHS